MYVIANIENYRKCSSTKNKLLKRCIKTLRRIVLRRFIDVTSRIQFIAKINSMILKHSFQWKSEHLTIELKRRCFQVIRCDMISAN